MVDISHSLDAQFFNAVTQYIRESRHDSLDQRIYFSMRLKITELLLEELESLVQQADDGELLPYSERY